MRTVRRTDREITIDEARGILVSAEYGVLSTVDRDGQPYGVPLSFVFKNDAIYFHSALNGHKLDNIGHNAKVCFTAIGRTKVLPDKFATEYESAVAIGIASEITGIDRNDALLWLLEKYCPDYLEQGNQYIGQKDQATKVIKIEISHISGKARR